MKSNSDGCVEVNLARQKNPGKICKKRHKHKNFEDMNNKCWGSAVVTQHTEASFT